MLQVVGWGATRNGKFSDVLLSGEVPYINYRLCILDSSPFFQHYITADKFCAGLINGKLLLFLFTHFFLNNT